MEILQINENTTLKEISKWLDDWCISKFGDDTNNLDTYYETSDDGRFVYGLKQDSKILDEYAVKECCLTLLLKIRNCNLELSGKTNKTIPYTYEEREKIKQEIECYYQKLEDINNKLNKNDSNLREHNLRESNNFESMLLCDEDKKNAIIAKLTNIINSLKDSKNHNPRVIAIIMSALHKEKLITFDNISQLAGCYFKTFGYKDNSPKDKKSLTNSLQSHLPINRTINDSDIEVYRDKLR